MPDFDYLLAANLAAETRLSLASVGRRLRTDAPPSIYIGRCRLFPAATAREWIERHRVRAA
jgi:hypothetical protein